MVHPILGNTDTTARSIAASLGEWEGCDSSPARVTDTIDKFFSDPESLHPAVRKNLAQQLMTKETKGNGGVLTPPATFTLRIGQHKVRIFAFENDEQIKKFNNGEEITFTNSKGVEKIECGIVSDKNLIPLTLNMDQLYKTKAKFIDDLLNISSDINWDARVSPHDSQTLRDLALRASDRHFEDAENNKELTEAFLRLTVIQAHS